MRVIGRFPFTAKVVPKGARKPRTQALLGLVEYEIPEVRRGDVVPDALVLTPAPMPDFPHERVTFSGWDGRLWEEALFTEPSLREALASPRPAFCAVQRPRTPLDGVYSPLFLDVLGSQIEEHFVGRVLWSDRAEAQIRAVDMVAKSILLIDGVVHFPASDPVWVVSHDAAAVKLSLHGRMFPLTSHLFRVDRLADAFAWYPQIRSVGAPIDTGEVEHLDATFLVRDDLSHHVRKQLSRLVGDRVTCYLPYLPVDMIAVWQELSRLADFCRDHSRFHGDDQPLPAGMDPVVVTDQVRRLQKTFDESRLPGKLSRRMIEFRKNVHVPFMQRVDFELERRFAGDVFTTDDAAALAALAAA